MGYYAKDGSYVRDAGDMVTRETQGQAFEREQRAIEEARQFDRENQEKYDSQKAFEWEVRQNDIYQRQEEAEQYKVESDRLRREEEVRQNLKRYGTEFDLRNPKDLGDRIARANYWRIQSGWHTLKNVLNGKSKKFMELDSQLRKARTEEERLVIVESMEKLFPTREGAVKRVENQQRRGR